MVTILSVLLTLTTFTVTIVVPPDVANEEVSIVLTPRDRPSGDYWKTQALDASGGAMLSAEWTSLPTGTYTVAVRLWRSAEPEEVWTLGGAFRFGDEEQEVE